MIISFSVTNQLSGFKFWKRYFSLKRYCATPLLMYINIAAMLIFYDHQL